MMVRLEGEPAGAVPGAGRSGMSAAAADAAGKMGTRGAWFQGVLALAPQAAAEQ